MSGVTSGRAGFTLLLDWLLLVICKMSLDFGIKGFSSPACRAFSCYDFHDRGASQRSCKNGFI